VNRPDDAGGADECIRLSDQKLEIVGNRLFGEAIVRILCFDKRVLVFGEGLQRVPLAYVVFLAADPAIEHTLQEHVDILASQLLLFPEVLKCVFVVGFLRSKSIFIGIRCKRTLHFAPHLMDNVGGGQIGAVIDQRMHTAATDTDPNRYEYRRNTQTHSGNPKIEIRNTGEAPC
jgi:hypothetical protein